MTTIHTTSAPAPVARPAAKAPESPAPTREQKLQMANDRYDASVRRAQERIDHGFKQGVECSGVAVRAGMAAGGAVGSLVGAGGENDAPSVLGEVTGALLTAPVCYAGAVANSFVQQGVMFVAKRQFEHEKKQLDD